MRNLLDEIRAERAKLGATPTPDELAALLNFVAWNNRDDGWGLSVKPAGTSGRLGAFSVAIDILHHRPSDSLFDVFIDASGRAEPAWNQIEHHHDPARPWLAPIDPGGSDPDDQDDDDSGDGDGGDDSGDVVVKLDTLIDEILASRVEIIRLRLAIEAQTAELAGLNRDGLKIRLR